MTTALETRRADWRRWREERDALATADHGPAALTGTHWLSEHPLHIDGLPGAWVESDGHAVGTGPGFQVDLTPGEEHRLRDLLLRPIIRAGQVALRVFDPQAPGRAGLQGIDSFDFDPAWVVSGALETTSDTLQLEHIDGFFSENARAVVRLSLNGRDITLEGAGTTTGGLQIVFADATNGEETQRFRFLDVPAPDDHGQVEVDFNRAYLPPCTFSDHFLCPLPPAGNRLEFPIRAGETRLRRIEEAAL
ncbi:DUF1684 domain-containing protein [Nocardia miyunensis]|uniref:DUF1684 domain-containing protein n=1 Tax=Nocardia miyunensis TaxID=282684 RepID=UPI00082D4131|nr:DUF1684 domain-containing protein [Nocardia miyunensis]